MKIILDDVYYKSHYIKHYEAELPNVKNFDEIPEGKLIEYITESLEEFIKE